MWKRRCEYLLHNDWNVRKARLQLLPGILVENHEPVGYVRTRRQALCADPVSRRDLTGIIGVAGRFLRPHADV